MDVGDFLLSLAVIFTAAAIYYHLKIFNFWKSRGIPGPTPWPIFGTNIYYIFYSKIDIDCYWREKYGKTYGLFDGYYPELRTSDASLIKQLFVKNFSSMVDRNHKFTFQEGPLNWLLFSRGDHWANQRALISPMFSASKIRSMLPTISSCVDVFIQQVDKRRNSDATFTKFDLSSMTLDVIASSFFGLKLDTYKLAGDQDEFIVNAYRVADFNPLKFVVWLFVPRPVARYFKFDLTEPTRYKFFQSLGDKILKVRRSDLAQAAKRNDIIQNLIDAKLPDKHERVFSELDDKEAHYNADIQHEEMEHIQKQQTKEAKYFRHFSDSEIKAQMTFFMIAGFETTASMLAFALFEMANQPETQQKILAELREALGSNGEILSNGDASECYQRLLNLNHLDAFVSEVLRLYPPILSVHRMVTDEKGFQLVINDNIVTLPKDVAISTNPFVVHRDSDYFENPEKFDNNRFLAENRDKIKIGSYLPFGIGPRHCAGMRFALLEIKLALAKLLLNFEILPAEANQYPGKFKRNQIFLQLEHTNFKLVRHSGK